MLDSPTQKKTHHNSLCYCRVWESPDRVSYHGPGSGVHMSSVFVCACVRAHAWYIQSHKHSQIDINMQCRLEHLFSTHANTCYTMPTCMFSVILFLQDLNMKHMHNCTVQSCDLMCVRYASMECNYKYNGIPIIKLRPLQQLKYHSKELLR